LNALIPRLLAFELSSLPTPKIHLSAFKQRIQSVETGILELWNNGIMIQDSGDRKKPHHESTPVKYGEAFHGAGRRQETECHEWNTGMAE
jgi:hypothetical protein